VELKGGQASARAGTLSLGRTGPVHHRAGPVDGIFLVVRAGLGFFGSKSKAMDIKGYLLPFAAALVVFAVAFLLLDMAVMNMQGLSLIFHK